MSVGLDEVAAQLPLARALLRMQEIKNACWTFPEKRAVDDCIEAVRTAFGVKEG